MSKQIDQNYRSTHVYETVVGYLDVEGYVDSLVDHLKNATEGYEYCVIENNSWDGYAFSVLGWRECTPAELEARAVQREKDKAARAKAKAKKEAEERQLLEKLKAKYEKNG